MAKIDEQAKAEAEGTAARSFAVLLAGIEAGRLNAEASDEMQKLTGELYTLANDVGKAKGTLTITLAIHAEDNGTVSILGTVKTKAPPQRHARSVYWVAPGNHLVKEDPKQEKLALRTVEGGKTRAVAAEATQEARVT